MKKEHKDDDNISARLKEQNEALMKIYGKLRSEWRETWSGQYSDDPKDDTLEQEDKEQS